MASSVSTQPKKTAKFLKYVPETKQEWLDCARKAGVDSMTLGEYRAGRAFV